jgi:hypothetical protein
MSAPVLTSLARAILHQIKRSDPQVAACLARSDNGSGGGDDQGRHKLQASYVIAELLSSRLEDLMKLTITPRAASRRQTSSSALLHVSPQQHCRGVIQSPTPDHHAVAVETLSRWPVAKKAMRRVASTHAQQIAAACRPAVTCPSGKCAPYDLVTSWALSATELGQLRRAILDADMRVTQLRKMPQCGGAPITKATTRSALRILVNSMVRRVVLRLLANSQQRERGRRTRGGKSQLSQTRHSAVAARTLARMLSKLIQSEAFWTKKVCMYVLVCMYVCM